MFAWEILLPIVFLIDGFFMFVLHVANVFGTPCSFLQINVPEMNDFSCFKLLSTIIGYNELRGLRN